MNRLGRSFLGSLLITSGFTLPAYALTLNGTARDPNGRPIAEAFVTAHSDARRTAETVLSDRAGHYVLANLYPGDYQLRVRKDGFVDGIVAKVSVNALAQSIDLKLEKADPANPMRPGSAWLAAAPEGPMKTSFITSCTICHDPGTPMVRGPRDANGWTAVIQQMRGITSVYGGLFKLDDAAAAKWLADTHFGEHAAPLDLFSAKAGVVETAAISEYEVGSLETWAHDMAIDPYTGDAWVVDYVKDQLIKVDPRSGRQQVFECPVKGAGMHTLNFDRDGTMWITFQLAGMIGRFDPKAVQWRLYGGLTPSSLPHSFALDSDGFVKHDSAGRIWFSEFGARAMGGLSPDSGQVISIPLPGANPGRPYGAALDSQGRVWFSNYYDNEIGFVDPKNQQGQRWTIKRADSGPHRMHIDDEDNLWIPLSGYGLILRHSTRDGSEKEFTLPDPDTFPYALRFDRRSHRVWIAGNGANSIYALDPDTGQTRTFRLPSHVSYPRMISIDYATGDVWTALSSYPNVQTGRDHGMLLRIRDGLDAVRQPAGK